MTRRNDGLCCPWCNEIRSGVMSLGIHISNTHQEKQKEFAQRICDNNIISLKRPYQSRNKDHKIAGSIAKFNSIDVRYYKTGKSNYNMPKEFHYQTVRMKQ